MIRWRWRLFLAIGLISLALAFLLRDVVYEVVIVPLAYILWVAELLYSAIPQWILWSLLLAGLFLVVLWNLLPEVRVAERKEELKRRSAVGEVEGLALAIVKSRHGNYFKWQLANRLGRIARRLNDGSGTQAPIGSGDAAVDDYLDAGLNYSFVDFPTSQNRFRRAPRTPLDMDPAKAADYLESQMEKTGGRHG